MTTEKLRSIAPYVMLGVVPWPLVSWALYAEHSYILALLGYHGLCLASSAMGLWHRSGRAAGPGTLSPASPDQVAGGPRAWSGMTAWTWMALPSIPVTAFAIWSVLDIPRMLSVLDNLGWRQPHLPWFAVYFLTVNPWAEEAFWRATIYRGLHQSLSEKAAACLSSFLFGAWHSLVIFLVSPALAIPGAMGVAAFGFGLTRLYRMEERRVLPVAVFHSLIGDLPVLLVWIIAVLRYS